MAKDPVKAAEKEVETLVARHSKKSDVKLRGSIQAARQKLGKAMDEDSQRQIEASKKAGGRQFTVEP